MEGNRIVYTPAEVQAMLGIKLQTVYDMLRSGEIPAIRIGRNYKIPKEKFDRWLSTETVKQTEERKKNYEK